MKFLTIKKLELFLQMLTKAIDEPFTKLVNLNDYKTGEKLEFVDNKVIISEKLARLTNKKVGDSIILTLNDNTTKTLEIYSEGAHTAEVTGGGVHMQIPESKTLDIENFYLKTHPLHFTTVQLRDIW